MFFYDFVLLIRKYGSIFLDAFFHIFFHLIHYNVELDWCYYSSLWSTNTHQPSCYFELGMGLWHICKIDGRL